MRLHYASEIANWKYDGFMKGVYMKPYFDNYDDLTGDMRGPLNCDGFAVFRNDELFGLFEYYLKDDGIEIGLAINPKFVGKGLSNEYICEGINFMVREYKYNKDYVFLAVEEGNLSAYHSYLKFGFTKYDQDKEEIKMRYRIKEM
jgi:ribosomal-protein-alanine N-acetyltransferase